MAVSISIKKKCYKSCIYNSYKWIDLSFKMLWHDINDFFLLFAAIISIKLTSKKKKFILKIGSKFSQLKKEKEKKSNKLKISGK